jgi:Ni/Fe-hydrogenase subunit HybB-like protein
MEGFVYPNEAEIQWSLMIVAYPYITGLVAGAFIVSSLYHVFGIQSFKPVARFSLVMALAFLVVAPMPLQLHLGHPERGFEIFLTPNLTSAMAGFGYIWLFYLILVSAETWLVFRKDIVIYAQTTTGFRRLVYSLLTLGVMDISERSLSHDKRIVQILAGVGIPAAFMLHGYVGFLFGSIKANPWWSTPLMPVIFPLSAIVSGLALLIVLYVIVMKMRDAPIDHDCLHTLGVWLFGFLALDLALEGLELLSMAYESEESWEAVRELLTEKMAVSFFIIQMLIGSLVPLVGLGLAFELGKGLMLGAIRLGTAPRTMLIVLSAALVQVGVFAMRWNVVIGGQLLSKSLRGFISYDPPLVGQEGILITAAVLVLPLYLFAFIVYLLPPWQEAVLPSTEETGEAPFPEWRSW